MKMRVLCNRIAAIVLTLGLVLCGFGFPQDSFAYEAQVGSVKTASLNIRSGPGTGYSRITSLGLGTQVVVVDEVSGTDGQTWCKLTYSNGAYTGYAAKQYIGMASSAVSQSLSDADFENLLAAQNFPNSYKPYLRALHSTYPNWTFTAVHTGLDWNDVIRNESVVGRNLVASSSKSSWKSVAQGAYDWDRNSWPGFDTSAWVAASEEIIKYYMDPRNFLDSTYVFQFLDQLYNADIHNASGVEKMVKGTFMESGYTGAYAQSGTSVGPGAENSTAGPGSTAAAQQSTGPSVSSDAPKVTGSSNVQLIGPGKSAPASGSSSAPGSSSDSASNLPSYGPGGSTGPGASGSTAADGNNASYVDMIMEAARQSGVNPYVLTSMIIQEQGKNGGSGLISGTTSPYEGIYNFYNVEAYQSGSMTPTQRGLWWASQSGSYGRPWNSKAKAIIGGAVFYGENYTKAAQNTFYLKKFNVKGSNLYKHQYMTNIQAAASEGYHLAQAYSAELRTAAHNFEIPVYLNMPDSPCPCPQGDGSPNNKLSGLGADGFSLTPSFSKDTLGYDLIVDNSVSSVNIWAQTIDAKAAVSGTGEKVLKDGNNTLDVTVTAENGTVRTYRINIIRQSGGPTYRQGVGNAPVGPGGSSGAVGPESTKSSTQTPAVGPGSVTDVSIQPSASAASQNQTGSTGNMGPGISSSGPTISNSSTPILVGPGGR